MASKVFSGAIVGIDAQIIEIECDVSFGLKRFEIVGLPDKAVEESKERTASAIKSCGFNAPLSKSEKIVINLAPADLKKEGALYDLPIALTYLLKTHQIDFNEQGKFFVGELSLDGSLRPIKGALSFALKTKEEKFTEIILPKENAIEASLSLVASGQENLKIIGVQSLEETINYLEGRKKILPTKADLNQFLKKENYEVTLDWIKGQDYAKRAVIISAAGGHNVLLVGPPGGGKSLLAKALPSILPPLSRQEIIELTKIYSSAGLLNQEMPIVSQRPFRPLHHTASRTSIIGGGKPISAGEITLAHRGILFMDEFPEFSRDVLEALRQPLEDRRIVINRANQRLSLPCSFTLIAAANPCPCGHLNDPFHPCTCTASQINKYKRKLSGPIIDRIDISVDLPPVEFEKLDSPIEDSSTKDIRKTIIRARKIQLQRFRQSDIYTNSEMSILEIKKYCQVDSAAKNLLKEYVNSGKLSARGYHRVLKVARTIADLEDSSNILMKHIEEALMYRVKK